MRGWIALFLMVVPSGCRWISTARNALAYPTVGRGEAANLAVHDSLVYATLAEDGLAILEAGTLRRRAVIAPPGGSESVDGLAVTGLLLFVLDARPPGHLSGYSLANPLAPRLLGPPRPVPVGPFSGVSAANGLAVVSGGTSQLTAWRYDEAGLTDSVPIATADLGRGQPNALVGQDGRTVYVATHYIGPSFGLEIIRLTGDRFERIGSLKLPDAGFTAGGAKPANFPIGLAELSSDSLLISSGGGLSVISTRGAPRVLETLEPGGPAVNLAAAGARAAVSIGGPDPAVVLIDWSGTRPRIIRRALLAPGTKPLGVALTRTSAAVAARQQGVLEIH